MSLIKIMLGVVVFLCALQQVNSQGLGGLKKKQPFKIIGNIGTSANFYTSNEDEFVNGSLTRPSFAWNVYGSMVAKSGDFSMPISFVVNQFSNSSLKPYFQMGISPTYKWAKLHLGYSNMRFSPLTLEGQSFRGVGLELTPGIFRVSAFYGSLNRSIPYNPDSNVYQLPQYSRTGYGVKVGIGNQSNFIDLMYFHAEDDSSTANPLAPLAAQENSVLGGSFKLTIAKRIVLTADGAISGVTRDLSFEKLNIDSANQELGDYVGKYLNYNASTQASVAGQSALTLNFRNFNSNIGYRHVQPDFKSFGTPYLVNDIELLSWYNYLAVAKGKVTINTSLSTQHNNLAKKLLSELRTQVGTLNLNAVLGEHTNLNLNYSGYNLKQQAGTKAINDSFRYAQTTGQYGISPSYNITKGNKLHYVSANVNYSTLKDQNVFVQNRQNTTNLATSLNYMLSLVEKPYSFSANCSFSKYTQAENSYKSFGATVGSSAQFLKKSNLNFDANVGYYINKFSIGETQRNITYSLNSRYQAKKHTLNIYANYVYTPPNKILMVIQQAIPSAVVSKNLASGISYNYNF